MIHNSELIEDLLATGVGAKNTMRVALKSYAEQMEPIIEQRLINRIKEIGYCPSDFGAHIDDCLDFHRESGA